ncbi:MarR family transcriptional regulator [Algoriphagus aestuariicola]|jgi:DNA-binding MarR family transcriptional regulator|uniref:HTH-type transcriptional regulator SarZ n=1 Tax=Algoriphagus aestuariicola TaxID=1852016 RepID=A0ABS3BTC3_9BACT|nr:MarR family transcriptional regulator [Algoriphagus aestuariicola]MBN7802517.1 MarR family transcriptional regulator [Algoriphagus aestuariicola]
MADSEFPILDLSRNLYSCSRLLIQRIQKQLNNFGLTYPQFFALSILWDEDGLRVNELGAKMNLDSGTLTPLLKKLESQNLLKRKRGEEDERTVSIHLTYPGKSLKTKVMEALNQMESELSSELPPAMEKLLVSSEDLLEKLRTLK